MDRNALTEQRRETVIGLLKGMNIKKSSEGGFDKDDVYECMQQLCDLYEKSIEELENTYEGEIVSLKDKYQKYDDNNELYISLIMEAVTIQSIRQRTKWRTSWLKARMQWHSRSRPSNRCVPTWTPRGLC